MVYSFGAIEIDEALFEVRENGLRRPVPPRVFDTVLFLVRNRHRVVTKGELLERVWSGTAVTDDALNQAIRKARRVFGWPDALQTVRGRGYRFVWIGQSSASDRQVLAAAESKIG